MCDSQRLWILSLVFLLGSLQGCLSASPLREFDEYERSLAPGSNNVRHLDHFSNGVCLAFSLPSLDVGSANVGCSASPRTLRLSHSGKKGCGDLRLHSLDLKGGIASSLRWRKRPILPALLQPGTSAEISVSFTPQREGLSSGFLEIQTDLHEEPLWQIPLLGQGSLAQTDKETFKQISRPKQDFLFVIDNSSTMLPFQASLRDNLQTRINSIVRKNIDYQLLFISMDTDTAVQESGCGHQGPGSSTRLVNDSTPQPILTALQNSRVGTHGSRRKAGLEAAYLALTPSRLSGCNRGFLRSDADLHLLFLSNQDDQSPQPLDFYVSFLKKLKEPRGSERISATSVVSYNPLGCRSPLGGEATAAPRYLAATRKLRGITDSICNSNWGQTIESIQAITFSYRTRFFLSRLFDPKTLQVQVNGTSVQEDADKGWSYDSTTNSINFSSSEVPPPGATIEVQYKAVCLP